MTSTEDPLLDGPVAPAPGTVYNTTEQVSPDEPTTRARTDRVGSDDARNTFERADRSRSGAHGTGPGVPARPVEVPAR
jgi:hypothetical protein